MTTYAEYLPLVQIGNYYYCRTERNIFGIKYSDLLCFDGDYRILKKKKKGHPEKDAPRLDKYEFPRDFYQIVDCFLMRCKQKAVEKRGSAKRQ